MPELHNLLLAHAEGIRMALVEYDTDEFPASHFLPAYDEISNFNCAHPIFFNL